MNERKKHNKYTQTIEAELDLHGYTRDEARPVVAQFLTEAKTKGFSFVRIIVGKGTHSFTGESILGPLVKSILGQAGLTYRPAKVTEGGEGALVVKLN